MKTGMLHRKLQRPRNSDPSLGKVRDRAPVMQTLHHKMISLLHSLSLTFCVSASLCIIQPWGFEEKTLGNCLLYEKESVKCDVDD